MSLTLFRTAFTALRVNLLRSFLTMLGIIIGVSAVIIMVALGAGAQQEVDAQIEAMGGNLFILMGSNRRFGGAATAAGTVQSLTLDHAKMLEDELYSVEMVAPESDTNAQVVYGNMNWATEIVGTDNRYLVARNWEVETGREFSPQEIAGGGRVALIGNTIKEELFGGGDPIGETIRINRLNVTVIGTLKEKGQDSRGGDQDDLIMVPLRTVMTRLGTRTNSSPDSVERLFVRAYDGENLDYVEEDIATLMRDSMRVQPEANDPFMLRNLSEMVETRAATQAIFNSLLAGVAAVSLLVGGIGIMNIMLVSVTERTREIGLRMAVGASPKNILNQFLIEAITLCGLGGAIGIAIAATVVAILPRVLDTPAFIEAQVVLISIGFSALIGIFFGYYPALKASRLQPIDALRYE